MIRQLHEQYGHIDFYDDKHIYVNRNNGDVLTSVTTLLKQYQQKFNAEYWSKKKAVEYRTSQHEVKQHWKKAALQGTSRGTIVHNHLENKSYNKTFPLKYEMPCELDYEHTVYYKWSIEDLIEMADKYVDDHRHFIPIKPELIVGNDKIAGQIDLLAYDTEKDEYILVDYKTDKKFERDNKYNKNFKRPLTKYPDCEFNKYSLQLSAYAYLLSPVVQIKSMYIIWFNNGNYNYEKVKVQYIDEIEQILN